MVTHLRLGSSEHRHLRELAAYPSSSDRPKQHYTYQYMSYSDSLNHTITTSVSIRVTPVEDYLVSWSILWSCFVVASIIAAWQVYREHRIFKLRNAASGSRPGHEDESAVDVALADGESVSTADLTRSLFRKLLLLAMVTRVALIPVQIWTDPMWWQFVSDTLPEMVFASAWTVLATFFVQLVGIAMGTGTNTSPGLVISATAYVVYLVLIGMQLVNKIASVLLYALMCCIYATLFGVVLYFCPRLISLMRPSLSDHRGLAVRLIVATTVCILIFGIHCVNYARLVIAPPRRVYWWYQYGALELIPAVTFLCIMHPKLNKGNRQQRTASPELPRMSHSGSGATFQRVDSGIRSNEHEHLLVAGSGHIRRDTPPTISTQVKGGSVSGYGAVSHAAATDSSTKS